MADQDIDKQIAANNKLIAKIDEEIARPNRLKRERVALIQANDQLRAQKSVPFTWTFEPPAKMIGGIATGITICLLRDGRIVPRDEISDEERATAIREYRGGGINQVTDEEAEALTKAGFKVKKQLAPQTVHRTYMPAS